MKASFIKPILFAFITILIHIFSINSFALSYDSIPGLIPLKKTRKAAGDLICTHSKCVTVGFKYGQRLSAEQADYLHNKYNVDLSELDVEPTSDLWSNKYVYSKDWKQKGQVWDQMGVLSGDIVDYEDDSYAIFEESRHTVRGKDGEEYLINFGRKIHNYLLRKSLLRKIGYNTPDLRRLAKIKIRFKNRIALKGFLTKFTSDVSPSKPQRWILNIKEVVKKEDGKEIKTWEILGPEGKNNILIMQDLTISSVKTTIIDDLYAGDLQRSKILNRRMLRSLLMLYELVDVPESVNKFKWEPANIISQSVLLDYEFSANFYPSVEDVQWLVKRIGKLSRADWQDVVDTAEYPVRDGGKPVAMLMVEKLISRRNFMQKVLLENICEDINHASTDYCQTLDVNYAVTDKKSGLLKDGVLTLNTDNSTVADYQNPKKWWVGYGARFSYGPNESPIGGEQLWAFGKSKIKSNIINNAMSHINSEMRTDLAKAGFEQSQKAAKKQLIRAIETGTFEKVPFGVWFEPVFSGNLIVSREIIAGSYLGADNKIQLVDSFGLAADAGVFMGTEGLNPGWFVSADARALAFKNFVHIRPVADMKSANEKELFPDIAVHKTLAALAGPLDVLTTKKFRELSDEALSAKDENGKPDSCKCSAKEKMTKEIVNNLSKVINVGESFIITDNMGEKFNFNVGYSFTDRLKAFASLRQKFVEVSRIHILRKSEDYFHIYHTKGGVLSFSGILSLEFFVPIVTARATHKSTEPETKFFNITTNGKNVGNEKLVQNLLGLREAFASPYSSKIFSFASDQATRHFVENHEYHNITHDAFENSFDFRLLWLRYLSLKSYDEIKITAPQNQTKKKYDVTLLRRNEGNRKGKDFQTLALDGVSTLIKEFVDDSGKTSLTSANSGRPGETFKGVSVSRQATFEGFKSDGLKEPYVNISYRWKGWDASKEKALESVDELNKKFGREMISKVKFNSIESLELYTINGDLRIYRRGIEYMASLSEKEVKEIFENYIMSKMFNKRIAIALGSKEVGIDKIFIGYQKKYKKAIKERNAKEATEYGLKMISYAENILPFAGFKELVGGEEYFYAEAKIYGFRVGDESDDDFLKGHTQGTIGNNKILGPIKREVGKLGMTESEFYLYWILNKL